MSELAYNANGDSFDVPAHVASWRVRRLRHRGAPELVYGREGLPLTIPVESTIGDLREAVHAPGKYRLDPLGEDGKCVAEVPAAYVQVPPSGPDAVEAVGALVRGPSHDAICEAMRLNTELARTVIDQFPAIMSASAEIVRAADGAGMPARSPRVIDVAVGEEEEEEEEDGDANGAPASTAVSDLIQALVTQIVPLVVTGLTTRKVPKLEAILDWRKAVSRPDGEARSEPATAAAGSESGATTESDVPPSLDSKSMAHFLAIQSALAPPEAALARQIAAELSPAEMRAWFAELSALSVSDAVSKISAFVRPPSETGGAA